VERIDWLLKTLFTAFGAVFSMLVEGMGVVFAVLVVFMLADYVTGIWAALIEKKFNVAYGAKGFIKKLYVIILIGLIALLERMVFQTNHLADGVAFAYLAIEFMSITQNGARLGAPVPPQVQEVFSTLSKKGDVEK